MLTTGSAVPRRTLLLGGASLAIVSFLSAPAPASARDLARRTTTVTHGTNPSAARPRVYGAVTWIGSVKPIKARTNDEWIIR